MGSNNLETCQQILTELARFGLSEIVYCAGSRNAPFIKALDQLKNTRIYSYFEERSAAFFALGRARALQAPVAIITTSGTAAAELLPACIEAYYSGVPLVFISADRPRRIAPHRGPQCIDQTRLMAGYAEHFFDLEKSFLKIDSWSMRAPLHINVCFDEPLIDAKISSWSLPARSIFREEPAAILDSWPQTKKPLVIVGALEGPREIAAAERICTKLGWPVYAEATSGLRSDLRELRKPGADFVLRLGSVPTTRYWRDLEDGSVPVLSVSPLKFTGLSQSQFLHSSIENFEKQVPELKPNKWLVDQTHDLYEKYPLAEPSLIRRISQQIGKHDLVYVGNSLPIREWDLAADFSGQIFANRGANGIDGQLSSFLGLAAHRETRSWCIVGDLTAMYDLSGPWILQKLKKNHVFVIVNNGGGQIFHRMYRNSMFENNHAIEFAGWAAMWSLSYQRSHDAIHDGSEVLELVPDPEQTQKFWDEL